MKRGIEHGSLKYSCYKNQLRPIPITPPKLNWSLFALVSGLANSVRLVQSGWIPVQRLSLIILAKSMMLNGESLIVVELSPRMSNVPKRSWINTDVSSVHFLWRLRVLWWPIDTDQLSLLLFHLYICLYLAYRRLLCSLFFFTGSCLGLQHNQTLHPCFIFNDSACAQTNSTLKHSWVEDVMQLTLVDLAAGYILSPCAYLPKPGGDSMQLMHTETQRANMWRFAKWHTPLPPSLGWQSRESKFGQQARTLIFADQISSMFNRCRPMGQGPNDGTLWLCSELI